MWVPVSLTLRCRPPTPIFVGSEVRGYDSPKLIVGSEVRGYDSPKLIVMQVSTVFKFQALNLSFLTRLES